MSKSLNTRSWLLPVICMHRLLYFSKRKPSKRTKELLGNWLDCGVEVVKTVFGSQVTVMGLAAVPERFPRERPL